MTSEPTNNEEVPKADAAEDLADDVAPEPKQAADAATPEPRLVDIDRNLAPVRRLLAWLSADARARLGEASHVESNIVPWLDHGVPRASGGDLEVVQVVASATDLMRTCGRQDGATTFGLSGVDETDAVLVPLRSRYYPAAKRRKVVHRSAGQARREGTEDVAAAAPAKGSRCRIDRLTS